MIDLDKLYADLREEEGLRLHAYRCTEGVLTIGYGHTGSDVHEGQTCTKEQAEAWLVSDVNSKITQLNKALPWWTLLPEPAGRALLNMCFQLGVSGVLKFTNTLSLLRGRKYSAAADAALVSQWAKQTPNRAKRVTNLFREAV